MSDSVIRVENLSKLYRIGQSFGYNTVRESMMNAFSAPYRVLKDWRGKTKDQSLNPSQPYSTSGHDDFFWALKDVSFEVKQGEAIGIIGRNGAGKSTLLKILTRITNPTGGYAEIHGRVGSLLEVGTGFHPELTGRENIYFNGAVLGMKRNDINRKFDEIVDFSGVEKFLDTPVKRYSSGMQVRLAFAVAAHLEPEVLLVDEVLAVGDAEFQKKCLGKMGEVTRGGRTVLFVSHNMAAILNLCTRGLLLDQGELVFESQVEPLVHHYVKSLRENTNLDISERIDRKGLGRVRFINIHFEDGYNNPIEYGISGQPITIILEYSSEHYNLLQNYKISVAFYDMFGQALFNCSSDLTNNENIALPSKGSIKCVIPRLPLSQSQYLLTIYLEVNQEIEDWLQNAAILNVIDGDFYGTGKLYHDGWQGKGVLVSHQWLMGSD